ncbi:hypothetical protein Tco_0261241 [Tanacetum coccineum]
MSSHTFSPAKPLDTLAKIISSTLLTPPSCIKAMLAIPHLSQVSSMAEIDSKEARMNLKAGICFRIPSHNKHTWSLLSQKKHMLQVLEQKISAIYKSLFSCESQAQENRVVLDEEQLLFIAGRQESTFDNNVDEPPVQDLALNVDHVFQADQCDAFDSDVDEAPTVQTMFMVNLSSADPIYDEAGPSYDSDILSEVQDHDNYIDSVGEYHEVHEMQNDIQQNYVVDADAEYTSDSNIIPYE